VAAPATAGILGQHRADDPPHQVIDGKRDQRIDEDRDEDLLKEQHAHRGLDAEQKLHQRHA